MTQRLDRLRLQIVASEQTIVLGKRLRGRRLALKMSQRVAAGKIGAPNSQIISDWERAVNTPSERYWPAIEKVYGQPRAWYYRPAKDTPATPDLVASLNGGSDAALARIEEKLDRALKAQAEILAKLSPPDPRTEAERETEKAAARSRQRRARSAGANPDRRAGGRAS